jgi:cell division protein ZapA
MTQVTVTINGRNFRMDCGDGEETHLTALAAELDGRIEQLRSNFGEVGDMRLTVMAALTVTDELMEMGNRLQRIEQELAALQEARAASAEHTGLTRAAVAAALNAAAERIERMTRLLNQDIAEGDVPMG